MPKYNYVALDAHGKETRGTLEVSTQIEAITRIKEMSLFPTKIVETDKAKPELGKKGVARAAKNLTKRRKKGGLNFNIKIPGFGSGVKSKVLCTFTRQLATLVDAGLPLMRGLRVLQKQERSVTLREIVSELAVSIEGGSTFSEALAQHPKVFNKLFVNMVRAGELGGVLEVVLTRLSEFMEKSQKIRGKVVAAMFYPVSVLVVAVAIMGVMMIKVIPSFESVFAGMLQGAQLPAFTRLVLGMSNMVKDHIVLTIGIAVVCWILFMLFIKTKFGRLVWDKCKLKMPVVGPVVSKVAISRFTRTLGTLVSSGVPILQALTIVKETAGNVVISNAVNSIHNSVKAGETITAPLDASSVFPPMVISMVDVGEQTGALPEMLLKIADTYDQEVDNAVAAMTSLLEPIMIVFLAVIVGSIVIAMFMPLITLMNGVDSSSGGKKDD